MLRSPAKDDLAFADELLDFVGIKDLAETPVATLSGGQFQRVLIARALAPRPKLLLLDEPTTGIDRAGQQRFIESIEQLKQRLGLTVVFVSHDLRAVSAVSDRIACLNLTLHYHDVPEHLPSDLAYRMFACDLEAFGLQAPHSCAANVCETHSHAHEGASDASTATAAPQSLAPSRSSPGA
jgi:zinc transport system ATP-binding protein